MFYDAKGLIEFCSKHEITTEQFLLCYLLHKRETEQLNKYANEVRRFPPVLIDDLVRKGYILNVNQDGFYYPDMLVVSDVIADKIVLFLGEEADELFREFPYTIVMGDRLFAARNMSPEDLAIAYPAKLKRSKSTHEDVMKALREQKSKDTVGMGLKKWFETEQWTREDNHLPIDFTTDL